MESIEHLELKRLAVAWLARLGCRAVATEVRCPIAKYRVDAAGWLDHADGSLLDAGGLEGRRRSVDATLFGGAARGSARRGPARPRTIVIECKQSRADFVRDDRDAERLKRKLEMLQRTRKKFERDLIPGSEPHLRESGSALFPEMETWDFEGSRTSSYRRCLRETERIERRLHGETKFHTMPRYRLADHFYLFTPTGLLKPHEVPYRLGSGRMRPTNAPARRGLADRARRPAARRADRLPVRRGSGRATPETAPQHRGRREPFGDRGGGPRPRDADRTTRLAATPRSIADRRGRDEPMINDPAPPTWAVPEEVARISITCPGSSVG